MKKRAKTKAKEPVVVRRLDRVVRCLRRFFCRHAFALRDLKLTGIPEPYKPADGASYEAWLDYHRKLSEGPHHTQRVEWPCAKCGKVFRAHCGLDISPEHGPVLPDSSRSQNAGGESPKEAKPN